MFNGSAEDLRRMENRAAELATEVAALLNTIERLAGEGSVRGRLAGPGFEVLRTGTQWTVRT